MSEVQPVFRHPYRFRILWAVVYISAISLVTLLIGLAATGIRTHSLPVGSVKLSVPYSKYVVGETITFTIQNNYNSLIDVVNNCPAEPLAVYYQINGSWVRQHDTAALDECPNEDRQVSVPAGGVAQGSFKPWPNLFSKPGKYRIVAFVEYYNALPYQDIEVIAPSDTVIQNSTNSTVNTNSSPQTTTNSTTNNPPASDDNGSSDD